MATPVIGRPGWLGLVITGCPEGATVERVVIGGLGWQAGMHSGDVIVAINKRLLEGLGMPKITQLLREPVGSEIELTLKRAGNRELLKVKPKQTVPLPDLIVW
jgi:C-terminal processing protease CtpA/Prc